MKLPVMPTEQTLENIRKVLVRLGDAKELGSVEFNNFMHIELNLRRTVSYRIRLLMMRCGMIESEPELFAKDNQKRYKITTFGLNYLGEIIQSNNHDVWKAYFTQYKSINKSKDIEMQ